MLRDQHVLLIHGLAETPAWMAALNMALLAGGYRTHAIDYPSTSNTIEVLTETHLQQAITNLAPTPKLHIVTHLVRYGRAQ